MPPEDLHLLNDFRLFLNSLKHPTATCGRDGLSCLSTVSSVEWRLGVIKTGTLPNDKIEHNYQISSKPEHSSAHKHALATQRPGSRRSTLHASACHVGASSHHGSCIRAAYFHQHLTFNKLESNSPKIVFFKHWLSPDRSYLDTCLKLSDMADCGL
jgi:hypothetical protein